MVATFDEYRDAARKGVRAFLLQTGAPVPDDSRTDELLLQIIGPGADLSAAKHDFATNYLVPRAVQQANVMPVCTPEIDPQEAPGTGQDFEVTIRVVPKPQLELTSYDPVEISVDAPAVSDEEVDAQIRALVQQRTPELIRDVSGLPVQPAIDDAWVAANVPDDTVNTVEQMRAAIRKSGEQQKAADFENYKLSVAAAKIADRLERDVPSDVIEAMAQSMMNELHAQAASQGIAVDELLDAHGMTEEAMAQNAHAEAAGMLRQGIALDAVYRHEGLSVEEQDRKAALHAIAPGEEDEAEEQLAASGYLFTIEETAQRIRAGRYILEHAKVTVRA